MTTKKTDGELIASALLEVAEAISGVADAMDCLGKTFVDAMDSHEKQIGRVANQVGELATAPLMGIGRDDIHHLKSDE